MSGCVNCVWDAYREEMEAWAAAKAEAERRLAAQEVSSVVGTTEESMHAVEDGKRVERTLGVHGEVADRTGDMARELEKGSTSMEEDGAGFGKRMEWDEGLYKDVPVGIREFMKQEKRLREERLKRNRKETEHQQG